MTTTSPVATSDAPGAAGADAARGLSEAAFASLADRHRREIHVHCYRLLASFEEAEDAVQETLLRAWRAQESFVGRTLFRAWLYRIATNVCLDMLRQNARRMPSPRSVAEVPWRGHRVAAPTPGARLRCAARRRLAPAPHPRQPPARRPGDSAFRAFKLDVLRIDNHAIAEITTFGYALFPAFGLPSTL